MTWATLVPRKGKEFPWIEKRAAKFIDQLGHNEVTLRCDNEPAIEALARVVAQAHQEVRLCQRDRQWEKVSPTDPRACGGARCWPGKDIEGCTGAPHGSQSPARRKDVVLVGGVCGVLDEQVRHRQGRKDTDAKTTRAKGQHTDPGVWARQTSERRKVGAAIPIPFMNTGGKQSNGGSSHQKSIGQAVCVAWQVRVFRMALDILKLDGHAQSRTKLDEKRTSDRNILRLPPYPLKMFASLFSW